MTLVIFTFVAIWHDIQLRLLLWGWLITLFIVPEVGISHLTKQKVSIIRIVAILTLVFYCSVVVFGGIDILLPWARASILLP